jgi:beta-mannosidase
VLASFKQTDHEVEMWLTNDLTRPLSDRVTVRLGGFSGGTVWEETREVSVAANGSACVWRLEDIHGRPAEYLHVESASGVFPSNRHFFAEFKDLVRAPVAPALDVEQVNASELHVRLVAPPTQYVYFAHLVSQFPSTRFTDNYVDLYPGELRGIRVWDPTNPLSASALRLGWA